MINHLYDTKILVVHYGISVDLLTVRDVSYRFDEIRASIEERKNGHTSVTEEEKEDDDEAEIIRQLGEERRQKMREMAKKLSMKISKDVLQRKDSVKSEPVSRGGGGGGLCS